MDYRETHHPTNRTVSIPVVLVFSVGSALIGTILSPIFSDRMATERRLTSLEIQITEIRRDREEDAARNQKFESNMYNRLNRIDEKLDLVHKLIR